MARRRSSRTQLRWLGAILLIVLIAAVAGWWHLRHWQPDRSAYPVQGIEVGAEDGVIDWRAVKAIGSDFAYIDASASAFARDPSFARNLEEARAAKLQVGALHRYDPCQPADKQAANFITVVPREAALLRIAIIAIWSWSRAKAEAGSPSKATSNTRTARTEDPPIVFE